MHYQHRFLVKKASLDISDFHKKPCSLGFYISVPVEVKIPQAPDVIAHCESVDFELWVGPSSSYSEAIFENVTNTNIRDWHITGPVKLWVYKKTNR